MSLRQRQTSRIFRQRVGARLRDLRRSLDMSQEEVAWEADVAQGSISNYEAGRNDIPLSVLVAICRALGTTPADVLHSVGEMPAEPAPELARPV
ncbi:MAG: helix-turn-helix transcriptional regulator [Chloroflexi bacterium]|nr:helix-turn-helix transcriptional regulator [Chloroflexota bacterium]